ncbi:unnamed protein product [Phytomonas sp. Hart1]|nr:unnamed protein product [Phytomonas sp. Hart1]|eukprot:CCW67710.1 unnamed protein product [Phytomonas sp. isolate Hart1]
MELSKHVVLRDSHLLERKLDLISISNTIKGALSSVNTSKSVLRECVEKQKMMDRLLQGLEEAVDPAFQRVETALALSASGNDSGLGVLRNADRTRYTAFQHAIGIYDEMMGLRSRLDVAVRQHRQDFEETRGKGEVDRVMGLVSNQLSALESCSELATALEKELDKLLGATYTA